MTTRRPSRADQGKRALGAAITYYREQAGLSAAELSRRSGVSRAALRAIEQGHAEPHWSTARRIAAGLDVGLEQIAELAERLERGEALPADSAAGAG